MKKIATLVKLMLKTNVRVEEIEYSLPFAARAK